ncbi:unnamed protein product [Sphenostylis stenocarpa]|uniref:Uncharacterized protein n=1 Tax=Sphenostylis stenocarpa TaxID=92480 RepID=A0AA86S4P5_9FABA|nr:unnamed protein product [Sphenostylis stenocarpa]
MNIRQQSVEGFQNESESTVPQAIPQATTNEMNGLSPPSFMPMNEYEEIMALLTDDNDNYQQDQALKHSKTFLTTSEEEDSLQLPFQLDHSFTLEEILGQGKTLSSQTQVGGSSSHELRDFVAQSVTTDTTSTIQLNSNSFERMDITISPGVVVSIASISIFGENSSNGPVQQLGNNVFNPIFSSQNCSNSILSMPENTPKFWPSGSNALYPPQAGALFGDSTFPNTTANIFTQFVSPSFPMHPFGCASFGTSASGLVGNSVIHFQSPSFPVHPYAGPSVGNGADANNLDGHSLNQFQSPSLPGHPYVGPRACPSKIPCVVGTGAGGANNLDGNSLTRYQSSSFPVHTYGGIASASVSANTDASVFSGAANANANASPYGSHQQFTRDHRFEMSRINPLAAPSAMGANIWASPAPMMPNQTQFFRRQPLLTDFKDLVQAWEVN